MSEVILPVGWSGPRVFIREIEVMVDVCDDYRENFRFERFHPVYLRSVLGRDEIVVEDMRGRHIGVVHEDYYMTLDAVMRRFSWGCLSLSGWTNCEVGTQSLVITVYIKVVCTTATEEDWFHDLLDYWWGLDGEAESMSA